MSYAKTLVLQNFQLVGQDFEEMVKGYSVHTDPAEVFSGTDLTVVWVPYAVKGDRPAAYLGLASWWARVDNWKRRVYFNVQGAARAREQATRGEIEGHLLAPERRLLADYLRELSPQAWENSPLLREALSDVASTPEAVAAD